MLSESENFWQTLRGTWEHATRAVPPREHCYDFGGVRLQLRVVGEALERALLPALATTPPPMGAPLAADSVHHSSRPPIRLLLWDARESGVLMPPPPYPIEQLPPHGVLWGTGPVRAAFDMGAGSLNAWHQASGEGICAFTDARRLPFYERAAPLRTLLSWGLPSQGVQLSHAAAVGNSSGAILLAGRGGSGKSTTALACVANGFSYLGDDYTALSCEAGKPRVHALYHSAKLDENSLHLLPVLRPFIRHEIELDPKAVLDVRAFAGDRVADSLPVRAIILPRVGGTKAALTPASRAEVLRALGASTVFQIAGGDSAVLERLTEFVRAVPYIFRLELGPHIEAVPSLLRDWLAGSEEQGTP